MRRLLTASAALALAACAPEAPAQGEAPPTPANTIETPAPTELATVEGWQTDPAAYTLMGATLPAFTATLVDGGSFSSDALRGRWTILAAGAANVWGKASADANAYIGVSSATAEKTFFSALVSAADQDPELDVVLIHRKEPGVQTLDSIKETRELAARQITISDDGSLMTLLSVVEPPAYLLIGPDLTIEGYRGALSATPQDGVKPVFRGIAEIRKQVAAPG